MRTELKLIVTTGLLVLSSGFSLPAYAQTDFSQCLARLERTALDSGIRAETVDSILPTVEPREAVIRADRNQPEFLATFADYLGRRATDERVARGRALYAEHRSLLDELTRRYGVPGHYIVAFWGLETNYGSYLGNVPVFDSLSTLACDARRSDYFTEQFVNALRIVDRGDVEPGVMRGSWAGAMGQTQFMPSNYLSYAVDGDGDGRVDLWNSTPDALTSAANFLRGIGWQGGIRWGREVLLPEDFDYGIVGRDQRKVLNEWRNLGVTDIAGRLIPDLDMQGAIVVPAGQRGPAFIIYDNFDVIMRWNRSEFFALTVGHLADRIAGGGRLANPPVEDEPISRDDVVRVQQYLAENGYDGGTADGIFGSQSRAALRALQRDLGLVADGFLSQELLRAIGITSD
ncbi:MAG: lytic murein transglycosylase [Gammaproteobacteria bacterium]|nr:lytic murein transglycosylase [Gammaproteobacteria bacterium]MDH3506040.1 lytic murein transglycosylase [Gammaproteobacteria bacterium]